MNDERGELALSLACSCSMFSYYVLVSHARRITLERAKERRRKQMALAYANRAVQGGSKCK
jgi:hypothetical protein